MVQSSPRPDIIYVGKFFKPLTVTIIRELWGDVPCYDYTGGKKINIDFLRGKVVAFMGIKVETLVSKMEYLEEVCSFIFVVGNGLTRYGPKGINSAFEISRGNPLYNVWRFYRGFLMNPEEGKLPRISRIAKDFDKMLHFQTGAFVKEGVSVYNTDTVLPFHHGIQDIYQGFDCPPFFVFSDGDARYGEWFYSVIAHGKTVLRIKRALFDTALEGGIVADYEKVGAVLHVNNKPYTGYVVEPDRCILFYWQEGGRWHYHGRFPGAGDFARLRGGAGWERVGVWSDINLKINLKV